MELRVSWILLCKRLQTMDIDDMMASDFNIVAIIERMRVNPIIKDRKHMTLVM